jgi:lycopene beta-cyclase
VSKLWDVVIVGGGLGGLSLAVELAGVEFSRISVLVLEKRKQYVRDRTWSYWTSQAHRYSHLERRQWKQWLVSLGGLEHHLTSQHCSYASLDADVFYSAAINTIEASSNVVLQMETTANSIVAYGSDESMVTLQNGDKLRAHVVFDARSPPQLQRHELVQQFSGWEVQTSHDVFNADEVKLMAFESDMNGIHFFYVLPYSSQCALVESTWISPAGWQPDFDTELRQYLAKICGVTPYGVSYREYGVLGLQNKISEVSGPVGLGCSGGALRPSTGYAFIDTITHASKIARSLSDALRTGLTDTWLPLAFHRSAIDDWMDSVFLDVLARNWYQAPKYFMQLFGAVAADDAVAFLTGHATVLQRLRIMRALPTMPFVRSALLRRSQ